jgi:cardiolipin synthase A/B
MSQNTGRLSPVRKAAVILLVAAAFVTFVLLLHEDVKVHRIESALAAGDPDHAAYVAALTGAPLTVGNRYDVLTNGVQIFPAMLEAIDAAEQRISFETYIYEAGEMADQFTAAFERAATRGVVCNMVLDAVGTAAIVREHVNRLKDAGCVVSEFNRPQWHRLERINYRTHRKILVVDGRVGFTGGVSVGDKWIGDADAPEHWRDTQVRMHGPIVRLLEAAFYENFIEATDQVTPLLDVRLPPQGDEGASFLVRSSSTGGANDMKRLYLLAIAAARNTLDVQSPYFVPDEASGWAFEQAVQRGVRIRILVESDETDAMPVKYASRSWYDRLLQQGIEIYEYQPTLMHAKVMVVDGVWSMFGSANFDNRSLELNDELNVAVTSRDLAARFLQDFEHDLTRSHRLVLEQWRRRPLLKKAREQFWSAFGEVF